MKNNLLKKGGSFVLVANIVLAVFAFAFILSLSSPIVSAQPDGYIAGDIINPSGGLWSGFEGETLKAKLFGTEVAGGLQGFVQGLAWAGIALLVVPMIGDMLGLREETSKALSYGIAAGLFAGKTLAGLQVGAESGTIFGSGGIFGGSVIGWGIGIGVVVFLLTYKKEEIKVIEFQCQAWEAPIGGNKCEECNDGIHPCSEYRCKSLGQACEIVDPSNGLCVWVNPKDVDSALITPWQDILTNDYSYARTNPRPPSWGTEIVPKNDAGGCIQAFTPIEFGIQTNKPTQCKIDFAITETYDEMEFYVGENNLFDYNHSQRMNLPNAQAIQDFANSLDEEVTGGLEIQNDNEYNLYIRCSTANGFYNIDPYVIRFCVDDGPDATPPIIVETSIRDNQPVQFEVDDVPIEVYTNELTNCKWSKMDKSFNDMENGMTCSQSITDINVDLLYTCSGTLDGIQDRVSNEFYFRCEDQPYKPKAERNVMTQSHKLTLLGTESLNIKANSVLPETGSTVKGATSSVEVTLSVETQNGFNNGEATCYYSINDEENYVQFFETDSHIHKQRQDLPEGSYKYFYKCVDAGGNAATANTEFDVFIDTIPPQVVRILRDSNNLKIITDEDAVCRFTNDVNVQCNFDLELIEGSAMQYPNSDKQTEHLTAWSTDKTYYIKCRDENGKQPAPTQCSVIVKPVEI